MLPLQAENISLLRAGRALLDGVSFTLPEEPAVTVLLGPNGAGKSLLTRVLAHLAKPDTGHVRWAGTAPDRARARRVGIVFQKPVLLRRSALANIAYVLALEDRAHDSVAARSAAALAQAGLAHVAQQRADTLSSGEQQRLALARAIAAGPEVLLLDEPAANLDPLSTAAIEEDIRRLRACGLPVLFITHDLAQARRIADRVVFMHEGRIREIAGAAEFFCAPRTREAARFIKGELLT